MMIKRLTMHNFGVYAATNTFEFVSEKPIVLIGGLNGRGKTTFLEAVLLSLYGANSFAYKESSYKTYGQYLRSFVNRSDGTMQTFVELEIELNNSEKDRYTIHREWNSLNKIRTSETIQIQKNDKYNEFLTQNWSMFVENILPSALSNFFFFDGEKIAELAVDQTNSQIKESIRAMLGLSTIDTLKHDLNRNIKKLERKRAEDQTRLQIHELRKIKEDTENKLLTIDQNISKTEDELKQIQRKIEKNRAEYATKGGNLAEQQHKILEKKTQIDNERHQNINEIMSMSAGELPLSLVRDLLCKIADQGEKEQNASITKKVTNKINTLFSEFKNKGNDVEEIRKFVQYVNEKNRDSSVKKIYNLSEQALYQTRSLADSEIQETVDQANDLLEEKEKLDSQLAEFENYLSIDIDEDEINKIVKDIGRLEQLQEETQNKLENLNQQRTTANGEAIKANAEFKRNVDSLLKNMEASDDGERDIKYSEMALRVLDEYSVRLQKKKVGNLGQTITACYKKLANKKNLIETVEMDPVTLDLIYLDQNRQEVEKTSLSAGEKQLMVISILWALAICSKKKLPVIIDTPLSRLDSNHRKALIQIYFPQASEQTIILSTDSEIDSYYYKLMKDNVGDEFTLKYNDTTKSTTIQKGYFAGGEL